MCCMMNHNITKTSRIKITPEVLFQDIATCTNNQARFIQTIKTLIVIGKHTNGGIDIWDIALDARKTEIINTPSEHLLSIASAWIFE